MNAPTGNAASITHSGEIKYTNVKLNVELLFKLERPESLRHNYNIAINLEAVR